MIEALASEPQYRAHLEPVFNALPSEVRGPFHHVRPHTATGTYIVASYKDLWRLGRRKAVLMEHGAGQSYSNRHPAYAGGRGRESVVLFLCPNRASAERNRRAYPQARVEVIGDPRVEELRTIRWEPDGSIAVSFHWNGHVAPETQWSFPYYRSALADLAKSWKVIGHAHPRAWDVLAPWYEQHGIEPVASFAEVCSRSSLFAVDNSSTLYEFAALGRPVLALNAPHYRREVHHGLRFWEQIPGIQVDEPDQLDAMVELALEDPPAVREHREQVIEEVYPVHESIAAAVEAICSVA